MDAARLLLVVNITAVVLAFALTLPTIASLIRYFDRRSEAKDQYATYFYADRDGEATGDAVAAVTRWKHRLAIAAILVVVCGVALSRAIANPAAQDEWMHFGISALLLVQGIALLLEPQSVLRFSLGLQISANALIAMITLLFHLHGRLIAVECASLSLTCFLGLLLPRRPDVCRNGRVIDGENSTSFLGRITFSWAATVMALVGRGRDVDGDELPELDHDTRAENLQRSFVQAKKKVQQKASPTAFIQAPMWRVLLGSHRYYLLLELSLCLIQAVVAFTPNMSLLVILRLLEGRAEHPLQTAEILLVVVMLGLSLLLSSFMENWLYWVAWNKISVRVYEQISIMVFNKAMRLTGASNPNTKGEGKNEKDAETQNTINLVAVDGQRISTFATFSFNLLLAPLKLVVACAVLNHLLGWQSLLAGIGNLVILAPLIALCGRKYAAAGGDLMRTRDGKMAILSEVLQGIRQIKFAALENKWERRIHELRKDELSAQRRVFIWNATTMSLYLLGPILLAIGSLGIYAIRHNGLTSSVAFTAISILVSIQISLGMIPELLSNMLDALGSMARLDEFFMAPEKQPNLTPSSNIGFNNATVVWFGTATKENFPWMLRGLNLDFPRGDLSIISGRTGSGKSLLLAAILGECDILDGEVKAPVQPHQEDVWSISTTSEQWIVDSAFAYVAQLPWIEAATVKENILFGLPFHAERYKQVLHACALLRDLEIFPDGERTEIGPNGVNMSGGQKARISLARALYSRAGVLILDDIFSAVDVHTAQHLYKHALTGPLADGRTRILATHHVGVCLPGAEYMVYLQNGMVEFAGTPADLQDYPVLEAALNSHSGHDENDEDKRPPSTTPRESDRPGSAESQENLPEAQAFVEKERGRTSASVPQLFDQYVSASASWHLWGLLLVGCISYTALTLGRNWWLRTWSSQGTDPSIPIDPKLKFYLGIYVAIAACEWAMGSLQVCLVFLATLKASESLFQQCLSAILRAPLRWLDTVPLGQILNRFSADFNQVDSRLCADLTLMLNTGMVCVGVVVAGVLINPLLVVFIIPLTSGWLVFARQYLIASREVKRIENISRSPVYEQINTSLTGLWTIRAYGKSNIYIHAMHDRIDRHARAFWAQWLLTRWLGLRVSMIGAVFAACVAALVTTRGHIDAATAGFTISFAVQLTSAMTPCIRSYTNVELGMNAIDRVLEYSNIEPEAYDGVDLPASWPTNGRVEVTDLTVKYAPSLPPVLNGLNFVVEGNQRIGIVGRTGAGKSSLALTLFRFLEASDGQILIDGVDISTVKLAHLRSRLAIIPQNPVLFSGTIRSNLDPFDQYEDGELLSALSQARFIPEPAGSSDSSGGGLFSATAVDLETRVSQGGLNFSQGQRQLLCLARAIVSNPKILMLDEATSAVDHTTDSQIQEALRARFGRTSSTLLVIAHRLSTIADFDRILVLDNGAAVEFGHPRDLMEIQNGVFRGMVDEDAEREKLVDVIYS